MKTCPACGSSLNEEETICPECGTEISSTLSPFSELHNQQQQSLQHTQTQEKVATEYSQETLLQRSQSFTTSKGKLILKEGGAITSVEYLISGKRVIIGRFDPEKGPPDIDLSNLNGSQYISRRHVEIYQDDNGKWYIKDLGSTNGTFIFKNGYPEKIQPNVPQQLLDGMEIALGPIRFIFKVLSE